MWSGFRDTTYGWAPYSKQGEGIKWKSINWIIRTPPPHHHQSLSLLGSGMLSISGRRMEEFNLGNLPAWKQNKNKLPLILTIENSSQEKLGPHSFNNIKTFLLTYMVHSYNTSNWHLILTIYHNRLCKITWCLKILPNMIYKVKN